MTRLVRSLSSNSLKIKRSVNAESQSALLAYLASHFGLTESRKAETPVSGLGSGHWRNQGKNFFPTVGLTASGSRTR